MHFADLTPYTDAAVPTGLPRTWNVGWLGSVAPYARGTVDPQVSRRLAEIVRKPVRVMRGRHECEFCRQVSGTGEVWIAGANDQVYAAPSMIFHYVNVHHYVPPVDFINVLQERGASLSDADCERRISKQFEKLRTKPKAEDILVPYYSIKIHWRRDAFDDLDAFTAFLSKIGAAHFNARIVLADSFAVLTEAYDPRAVFRGACEMSARGGRAPFKCTFEVVHLGTGGGELLAEEILTR